jgi:hypothetical protein
MSCSANFISSVAADVRRLSPSIAPMNWAKRKLADKHKSKRQRLGVRQPYAALIGAIDVKSGIQLGKI